MQLHMDFTVESVEELERHRARAEALGARLLLDRSDDPDEPLYVLADPPATRSASSCEVAGQGSGLRPGSVRPLSARSRSQAGRPEPLAVAPSASSSARATKAASPIGPASPLVEGLVAGHELGGPPVIGGKPMPMIEPMLAPRPRLDDALLEALRGLERLGEQHPVLARRRSGICSAATGNSSARPGHSEPRRPLRRSRRSPRPSAARGGRARSSGRTTAPPGWSAYGVPSRSAASLGRLVDLGHQLHVQLVGELQRRRPGSRPGWRRAPATSGCTPSASIARPSLTMVPITREV